MDRFDILEAMSGIRDEYIEEAAGLPDTVRTASETKAAALPHFSAAYSSQETAGSS